MGMAYEHRENLGAETGLELWLPGPPKPAHMVLLAEVPKTRRLHSSQLRLLVLSSHPGKEPVAVAALEDTLANAAPADLPTSESLP